MSAMESIDEAILSKTREEERDCIVVMLAEFPPGTKEKVAHQLSQITGHIEPALIQTMLSNAALCGPTKSSVVLIDDLSDTELNFFCECVDAKRLEPMEPVHRPSPISGMFFGLSFRMIVVLPVSGVSSVPTKEIGPALAVPFIYVGSCPELYLRRDTMRTLFPSSTPPRKAGRVVINGSDKCIVAHEGRGMFENVDVLGQAALIALGWTVSIDYKAGTLQFLF